MKNILITAVGLIWVLISCQQNAKEEMTQDKVKASQEISFYTPDSIQIFGDLYETDKSAPTILLFHQGGSNAKGEYGPIIPELISEGFNVFAIDQRRGGQRYGEHNRTVARIPYQNFSYCDAYPELEGALNYIMKSGFSGNIILWGSSYSASLAIQLASKHEDQIAGVLAFSPASGEPMQGCTPDEYIKTLKIPLLLLRPPNEMAIESVKNQFELAQQYNHQVYVAEFGTHGSSMLVLERVGNNVDKNWQVVKSFLNELKGK
jgi:pimeloyl-ACP methyl ester carboxylesterase